MSAIIALTMLLVGREGYFPIQRSSAANDTIREREAAERDVDEHITTSSCQLKSRVFICRFNGCFISMRIESMLAILYLIDQGDN